MKDQKSKKSKKQKGKVFPNQTDDIDGSLANDGFEMDSVDEIKRNNRYIKIICISTMKTCVANNPVVYTFDCMSIIPTDDSLEILNQIFFLINVVH